MILNVNFAISKQFPRGIYMRIGEEFMEMKSINVIILDVTKATVFGAICMLTKNGFTKSIGLKSLTEDTHVFFKVII